MVGEQTTVVEATNDRVTWSYDNAYQLKNEHRSGVTSYNITYTYDSVGNRLSVINGGARTTSSYDIANELKKNQSVGGVTTYTYDANGNQLTTVTPSSQRTNNRLGFRESADAGIAIFGDSRSIYIQR